MRAVRIREAGGPEVLEIAEVPAPSVHAGHVAVKVSSSAMNRADCLQRRGVYPAPPGVVPDIPGLEFAGLVAEVGPGVTSVQVGDRVMGLVGGGAHAEVVVVHERELLRVPRTLDLEHAEAIPEAFMTAYDALVTQCAMRRFECVLVHAAASGVGSAAVQLAQWLGARVIGTSRSAEKLQRLGGSLIPWQTPQGFSREEASSLVKAHGAVDVIVDFIGAAYLDGNTKALGPGGRMVTLGLLGGMQGALDLGEVLLKGLTLRGSTLRSRPLEKKIELTQAFSAQVLPAFDTYALTPVVHDILPFGRVREAHERLEANEVVGKLVLTWS